MQIKNITDDMALLKSGVFNKAVAFTAPLSHDQTLGAQQTIRYNNILTNIGNAYDATTGIFVVPVAGIYSLSASMMGHPNNGIHLQLMKNGQELVRLWTGGSGSYELASHTLNVHLSANDKIWVQNRDSGDPIIYGGEKYNVFSAALLHVG